MGRRRRIKTSKFKGCNLFAFGIKRAPSHNKRYRIYHHKLQVEEEHYDNDSIDVYSEDEDEDGGLYCISVGINKESYQLHDPDYYDEFKDGD